MGKKTPKLDKSIQIISRDLICGYHYARCLDNIKVTSDKVPDLRGSYTFRMINFKNLNAIKSLLWDNTAASILRV